MATWLSLVNDLQKRLRESETASVNTDAYSTLLGSLVNKAKREIEDKHDWTQLRTVLSFTTSSGTATYTITGSNERSRFYEPTKILYDDTNDGLIFPAPDSFIDNVTYIGTTQISAPSYYRMRGISSGLLQITLYPTPDGAYTIRVPMLVPQAELAANATILTIPTAPVLERAYALALIERGEDGGTTSIQAGKDAESAFAEARMHDLTNMHDDEVMWKVV